MNGKSAWGSKRLGFSQTQNAWTWRVDIHLHQPDFHPTRPTCPRTLVIMEGEAYLDVTCDWLAGDMSHSWSSCLGHSRSQRLADTVEIPSRYSWRLTLKAVFFLRCRKLNKQSQKTINHWQRHLDLKQPEKAECAAMCPSKINSVLSPIIVGPITSEDKWHKGQNLRAGRVVLCVYVF